MNDVQTYFSNCPVDIAKMSGKWFIQKTSLGFWLNRSSPTVTYTIEEGTSEPKFLDEVRYLDKRGAAKEIVGYDTLQRSLNGQFLWQAKPWYLRFLKSEWGVVAHDDAYEDWAVTYFSKTTLTPEGMDIYSRTEELDDEKYAEILQKISGVGFLDQYTSRLYQTHK